MPDILSTLIVQRRVSIIITLRDSNIYDRRDQKLSESGFKKYFLCCAPLYQSHVFIANKHKKYCAANKLQNEVNSNKQFLKPSFCLIIIV